MKKKVLLGFACWLVLIVHGTVEAQMLNLKPEDIFTYRSNIAKVRAMGLAYLRLPILLDSSYCNHLDLCGNIAGLSWKEDRSSIEVDYSYGQSGYASSTYNRYSWLYAGNALSSLWWLPSYGYTPYSNRGNLLPAPSIKAIIHRKKNFFLFAGNFSREVRNDNDIWTNWSKLQSTDFYLGYSRAKTENLSFGFLGNYSKYVQKYMFGDQLYGVHTDADELSSIAVQTGISYNFKGDASYKSSFGAEIQYSYSRGSPEKPQRFQLIKLGIEPIIGFSNGYSVLLCKIGHYIENEMSATVTDLSGQILLRKKGLPFFVGAAADFSCVACGKASMSELSISGGAGALNPYGMLGLEVELIDFYQYWIEGAKTLKLAVELQKTRPILFRVGYKNTAFKHFLKIPISQL
jgi:hypothetical protein